MSASAQPTATGREASGGAPKQRMRLRDDPIYKRMVEELRHANMKSHAGLTPAQSETLGILNPSQIQRYFERVADKLLYRGRKFVLQVRQQRRSFKRAGVFGPKANETRLQNQAHLNLRSEFGEISVLRARRDVLSEMTDEIAFLRALGTKNRRQTLENALTEVFEDTNWENITKAGAERLRVLGGADLKVGKARRTKAAIESFIEKLRDRVAIRKAMDEAKQQVDKVNLRAVQRRASLAGLLAASQRTQPEAEPEDDDNEAELEISELLGVRPESRAPDKATSTPLDASSSSTPSKGPFHSKFTRTIDPDRRS